MAKILVVDDNPTNRLFFTSLLKRNGHRILEASNGLEALAVVREKQPDLVLTDLLMPIMDGFQFIRELRGDSEIVSTRVMIVSANYQSEQVRDLVQSCGVVHILTKPVHSETVLQTVKILLEQPVGTPKPLTPQVIGGLEHEHMRQLTDMLSSKVGELEKEVRRRSQAEVDLRASQDELELRVLLRTTELADANAALLKEIKVREQAQNERERLIVELQSALAELRTLSGMLPICSSCKQIRDDQGYWQEIETYFASRTDATFTHGICPACIKDLYPAFDKALKKQQEKERAGA